MYLIISFFILLAAITCCVVSDIIFKHALHKRKMKRLQEDEDRFHSILAPSINILNNSIKFSELFSTEHGLTTYEKIKEMKAELEEKNFDKKQIFYSLRINGFTKEEIDFVLGEENEISNA